jgi:hypothetical protein
MKESVFFGDFGAGYIRSCSKAFRPEWGASVDRLASGQVRPNFITARWTIPGDGFARPK